MDGLTDSEMSNEERIAILQKALVTNVLQAEALREQLQGLEADRDILAAQITDLVRQQEQSTYQQNPQTTT